MTFTKVEVHPYIKNGITEKTTYRPVSTLLNDSKVYERSLYGQINFFFENKFSRYQCGFTSVTICLKLNYTPIDLIETRKKNKKLKWVLLSVTFWI